MISDVKFETSSTLRLVSHEILKPISLIINFPGYVADLTSSFFSARVTLDKRVKTLEEENLKLKAASQLTKKLAIDLEKLNALWSVSDLNKERFKISQKNLLSSNIFQPLLVLDIERDHDIKINNPVISEEGLVGRISNLGITTAEVFLIQDIRSSIPVVSETSSIHSTLKGFGLERAGQLSYVKKTSKFSIGEKIFTSGLGGVFPKNILVGEIISIEDPADSEFLSIEIEFSQTPINQDFFLIYKHE
jgi:rod shape-determining protein MreC|tara:strand:+ start:658 stop:1401 length:744 start_codon:yes stop_codon:yes gene_type:complete